MTKPNIHVVHRNWDREFPVIDRAEGIYYLRYQPENNILTDPAAHQLSHRSVMA